MLRTLRSLCAVGRTTPRSGACLIGLFVLLHERVDSRPNAASGDGPACVAWCTHWRGVCPRQLECYRACILRASCIPVISRFRSSRASLEPVTELSLPITTAHHSCPSQLVYSHECDTAAATTAATTTAAAWKLDFHIVLNEAGFMRLIS